MADATGGDEAKGDAAASADAVKAEREARLAKTIAFYSSKSADNSNIPTLKDDFSKSLGGSAAEQRTEKQFGSLLRGEDKDGDVATMPTYEDEDDGTGRWVKFMSSRGCFAYAHSITCCVAFSKPDDYDSDDEAKAGGEDECLLPQLPERVDAIIAGGKTPLIVDTTDEDSVRTFYSYKASVLDLQELFRGPVLGGLPAKDAMEQARVALVTAIKEGNTLVLYLGNLVPKLLQPKKFHASNKFPECVFKVGVFDAPKERKKIFRYADKVAGQCPKKDGFRIVVVTRLKPDEYRDRLKKQLPFQDLQALVVR